MDGFPGWGGMYLNADPASNPIQRPNHIENSRLVGGNFRPRPSVSQFNVDPLHDPSAKIKSLVDFQVKPKKLICSLDGCPGLSTSVGSSLNWVDTDDFLPFNAGIYYSGAAGQAIIAVFDGRLYVGVDSVLKAFTLIQPAYGAETLDVSGIEQSENIATFPGFLISALGAFDGKLFIGLDAGAVSKIAVWDGLTVHDGVGGTVADKTAINKPTWMTVWRDKLVIGNDTANILIRNPGAVPGTYATVVIAAWPTQQMTSYRDDLYLVANNASANCDRVKKYDGAAITDHVIAGAQIVSLSQPGSVFGYMFFGYRRTATPHATIGRLDSAGTYVDAHKIFSALEVPNSTFVRTLNEYRGALCAGVINPGGALLMVSPDSDTAGTYIQQNPSGGDISQALVS